MFYISTRNEKIQKTPAEAMEEVQNGILSEIGN